MAKNVTLLVLFVGTPVMGVNLLRADLLCEFRTCQKAVYQTWLAEG